jgi:hypothetical protein
MTKATFDSIVVDIESSGMAFVGRAGRAQGNKAVAPVAFKLGVVLYVLASGASFKATSDAAGVGISTVRKWCKLFTTVCCAVLKPKYMPAQPPAPDNLASITAEFAARRGLPHVAMACDGSHVPFRTHHNDYKNYKGWYSTLVLAFVNSFYLFVDGTVGYPGRAGDNTVLRHSWLMRQIEANPLAWLGPNGVILGDGGAGDGDEVFMQPYRTPSTPEEFYFNFCHSSTRFFVEETFGRWKNRFRFLLTDHPIKHELHTQLVYCTLILHNVCTIHKDDAVAFDLSSDDTWKEFFQIYKRNRCPTCTRYNIAHCIHNKRNRDKARSTNLNQPVGTPVAQRAHMTESLWESLKAGLHDMHVPRAHEHAALMQLRASAGHVVGNA